MPLASIPPLLRRRFLLRRIGAAVVALATVSSCHSVAVLRQPAVIGLPDLPDRAAPSPEPACPAEWTAFAPPVTAGIGAAEGSPAIAEITRTAAGGDVVALTGSGFSASDSPGGEDAGFEVYGAAADGSSWHASAEVLTLDAGVAALRLPAAVPAGGFCLLWPRNQAGYGRPVAINRTEAWWVGPDQGSPGAEVSVFGRNLAARDGTSRSWVYLQSADGRIGRWAAVVAANPYRVRFSVPAELPAGSYLVWVHNGQGGSYGWSGPLPLAVTAPLAWDGPVFNVRAYGAAADGVTDDSTAVAAAYGAALQSRDAGLRPTLYFPAGTYLLSRGLGLSSWLRITGDGPGATILKCAPAFAQPLAGARLGLVFANGGVTQHAEVSNLTLDANGAWSASANCDHLVYCQFGAGSADIRFAQVRARMLVPGFGCAFFVNVRRLSCVGCTFIGGDLMLFNSQQQIVDGCTFLEANDQGEAIIQRGTSRLCVTGCNVGNLDSTSPAGQGLGRFLSANSDYGTQRDVYVADNVTVDCGPRPEAADQNSGEQILCEGNQIRYRGHPAAADAGTVTLRGLAEDPTGQAVIVTAGPGAGQYRLVAAWNAAAGVATLEAPWKVVPGPSATVAVARAAVRWAIYHNSLQGRSYYADHYTAMCGIEAYGGCFDWAAEANQISRMRTGLCLTALEQSAPVAGAAPCGFNLLAGNAVTDCWQGASAGCGAPPSGADLGLIGNVLRGNTFTGAAVPAVGLQGRAGGSPPVDLLVLDGNAFSGVPAAVDCDCTSTGAPVRHLIIAGNHLAAAANGAAAAVAVRFGAGTTQPTLTANAWSGGTYGGVAPSGAVAVSLRRIDLSAPGNLSAGLRVLSVGGGPVAWSVFSDVPWLAVRPGGGVIAPDGSCDATVLASAGGLAAGNLTGVLTFAGGGRSVQVNVTLTVPAGAAVSGRQPRGLAISSLNRNRRDARQPNELGILP